MDCEACCEHGGICTLPDGHEGLHNASGFCEWSDDKSIPREKADEIYLAKVREMINEVD